MGINYCLESALKMKSVSGIIIVMKYLPLLLARFCQIQESISAWLPSETLRTRRPPPCTDPPARVITRARTHTQWTIWRCRTKETIFILERVLPTFGAMVVRGFGREEGQ